MPKPYKIDTFSAFFLRKPIKCLGWGGGGGQKIRVGRGTGTTYIFYFGLMFSYIKQNILHVELVLIKLGH